MKRLLFNLAAVSSLVLCLATAALWIQSWYGGAYCDRVRVRTTASNHQLHQETFFLSYEGTLILSYHGAAPAVAEATASDAARWSVGMVDGAADANANLRV